jgi:hypothetical protein
VTLVGIANLHIIRAILVLVVEVEPVWGFDVQTRNINLPIDGLSHQWIDLQVTNKMQLDCGLLSKKHETGC